jgi:hypothetical protein
MSTAASLSAALVVALNAAAGAWGAWRWYRVAPSRLFWVLARAGQLAGVALAVCAGVLALARFHPSTHLFWLYALLPVLVAFVAEQLRVISAQAVLDARGLQDAQALGGLDEAAQRSVVLAIVRREMGTVTAAAVVIAFLGLRALGTA